jgi:hypothetical protein
VRVDRLRTQRLKRAPAAVDQRFTNRKGGLDPAVLGELAVQVGLDVATRQLARSDVAEVRQQVISSLRFMSAKLFGRSPFRTLR